MHFVTASSKKYFTRFNVLYNSIKENFDDPKIHLFSWNNLKHVPDDVEFSFIERSGFFGPVMALKLFGQGVERLIMSGCDIEWFSYPEELIDAMASSEVVITPHICKPNAGDQIKLSDLYKVGMANGDFVALSKGKSSIKFLKWYADVCEKYSTCGDGLFYNQTWLSMAPFLFDSVHILRHPGYNVAYWNVDDYGLKFEDGGYYSDGNPLRFFHFSGFVPGNPGRRCSYYDNYTSSGDILKIYQEYDKKIGKAE